MPVAKAIKIDRKWVGAPDSSWNPTISLFGIVSAGLLFGTAGMLTEFLPIPIGILLNAICLYLSFTVLHDAMHGTAHRSKKIGNAIGRLCGFALLAPLPIFRGVHHEHHGHANDPERDPDLVVAWGPSWLRPVSLVMTLPAYRWHFYQRSLWRDREGFREAVASDAALAAFLILGLGFGPTEWILTVWIAPVALVVIWLAFAFDYLPHYPHLEQSRYYDTRIYPGRVANMLLLGQNYHLIHHLWTTIPWYRYQQVFDEIEPELRERHCAIGWRSEAIAPKLADATAN